MRKVLILVFSNLKHDARVMRQIGFLKKKYDLTVCCIDTAPTADFEVVKIPTTRLTFFRRTFLTGLLLSRRFSWAYKVLFPYRKYLTKQLKGKSFDLIISNDIETLPLAFQLKNASTKILFDAHEYAPKHFENKLWWRILFQPFNTFLCSKYLPKVHGMMTIGQGLAREYQKNFGVKSIIVTNASSFQDLKPVNTASETIKIVHHGIINRSRKIELIIEIMNYLPDNFTLDLILVIPALSSNKTNAYLDELKMSTSLNKRIKFRDPVSSDKIISLLQEYDMGVILAPPINFNYANGLPNKLYDFIQARLGVVTGPTPEIANIVNHNNLGVVSENFTPASLAEKLSLLTRAKVQEFKNNANKAARELNAEKNEIVVNDLVSSILELNINE